ncbi:MAG: hypothetical protein CFE21_14940 [Bacteroidetes bacterium B1(2017)]|nr:MAG: hypothetical protein CFE21_14940 [Bacteroidetes bacterium B1(2017)]
MKHLVLHNPYFEKWLSEFHKILLLRGIGNGKEPMYVSPVREFLYFLELNEQNNFLTIKHECILRYHQYILNRPRHRKPGILSPISTQHHIQSIRIFFDFLFDCKKVTHNPVRQTKFKFRVNTPRQIASVEEMKILFRRNISPMMKAILSCAYGCGLRRSEMYQLNLEDINLKEKYILVRNGKGNKSRLVPMSDSIFNYINKYISFMKEKWVMDESKSFPFFLNSHGNRLTGYSLNKCLKAIINGSKLKDLKAKNITLHCLRHSIAVHLIENGAKIELVKDFLGHSQIDTTQLYAIRRRRSNAVARAFRF